MRRHRIEPPTKLEQDNNARMVAGTAKQHRQQGATLIASIDGDRFQKMEKESLKVRQEREKQIKPANANPYGDIAWDAMSTTLASNLSLFQKRYHNESPINMKLHYPDEWTTCVSQIDDRTTKRSNKK